MSGYRSLHREHVSEEGIPIWQVQSLLVSNPRPDGGRQTSASHLIWTASGDGCVRGYTLREKADASDENVLDASALTLTLTHALLGAKQVYPPPFSTTNASLGCSQVSVIRNYVGDDDTAGDILVASLDMVGRIRVWSCTQQELSAIPAPNTLDDSTASAPTKLKALQEFQVEGATGTILALCPPSLSGHGNMVVAVACLDGSVAMVATGVATPSNTAGQNQKTPSPAGTILDRWGSGAIVLSLAWHPSQHCIVVGRKDGVVDIIPSTKRGTHRVLRHSHPVRAVSFTPDAQLLITGCDDGLLCVWDINRKVPTLVHHVVKAHATWLLGVAALSDSRRFITFGVDNKIHVWDVGQLYAPVHTFQCDHTMWTIHAIVSVQEEQQHQRLVCGSDKGWIQLFSLE